MSNYQNAGEGMRKMYISQIGMLICLIFLLIPIINIVAAIVTIVFMVISAIGLYKVGQDIKTCKVAFILQRIAVAVNLISNFVAVPFELVIEEVLPIVVTCMIFYSVSKVMRENGEEKLATQGSHAMWIFLITSVLSFVAEFVIAMGSGLLLGIIAIVLSIVGVVLQLRFYKHCAERFSAHSFESENNFDTEA